MNAKQTIEWLLSPHNKYDDPKTWKLIQDGRTTGCFQVESQLCKKFCKLMRPENIEHLSALIAIVRPGVLEAMDENDESLAIAFCKRKNGEEQFEYMHTKLEPILNSTFGIIVFQEQAMRVASELAGFSLQEADDLRKAAGKKKPEEMSKIKIKFLEGAAKLGYLTTEDAIQVFEWIEKSQRYSFNKCISKDERLKRCCEGGSSFHPTIEEIYNIKNDIEYAKLTGHNDLRKKWRMSGGYGNAMSMCEDGRVRKNLIIDIQPSGTQKVYRLTLESGNSIKVTENHKFPTSSGEKTLAELMKDKSIKLFECGEYEKTTKKYSFSNQSVEEILDKNRGKSVFGQFGEDNIFYANGSYSDFVKADKEIPLVCKNCGKLNCRFELHHINGDRTNSKIENLERLCVSCHKKAEYKMGRTKRGEKGYPVSLVSIKSIEYVGDEETYDVTMEGPNHNYVNSQNIVTCNSHSVSYAVLSYAHAYIKSHLSKKFFCSWLAFTKDKKKDRYEEVEKLVLDSKLFLNDNGRPIDILGPDFRTLNEEFQIEDDDVRFGITDIRGVGDSSFKTLVEKVNSYELKTNTVRDKWNWYEFLVFSTQLSKSTVEALISSGAIAYFKVDKRQMYYEYDKLSSLTAPEAAWLVENAKQFDNISSALTSLARPKKDGGGTANKNRVEAVLGLVSSIKNPPYSLKDTYSFIAFEEKKSLGVALTCSKVDDFDNESANCVCKDLNDGKTGFIVINAEIGRCAEHVIGKGKNKGKTMAFLTITDSTGGFDNIPCFSDTWKQYGSLLATGNTVVLQGERKDKKSGLMIKKVRQL